jgi:hypothetical protein
MQKIAIFGKPAGAKSTLHKAIARKANIPLHPLNLIDGYLSQLALGLWPSLGTALIFSSMPCMVTCQASRI